MEQIVICILYCADGGGVQSGNGNAGLCLVIMMEGNDMERGIYGNGWILLLGFGMNYPEPVGVCVLLHV